MSGRPPNPIGKNGAAVAANIRRIRIAKKLSYAEVSRRLTVAKWPMPVLSLTRLEKRERRVDVDDLVAIAGALEVAPSELAPSLVSGLEEQAAAVLRHKLDAIAQIAGTA